MVDATQRGNSYRQWVIYPSNDEARELKYRRVGKNAIPYEGEEEPRSEVERDVHRVLYSAAFRRLAGVTQIVPPDRLSPTNHTRLTHSLKVSQIAGSLAARIVAGAMTDGQQERVAKLGGLDPAIAEAAGLAHDIGHPPFGHAGEKALEALARDTLSLGDGFEGNAQTFRIASFADGSYGEDRGMGLTTGTLSGILKYPWGYAQAPRVRPDSKPEQERVAKFRKTKFGYYQEDLSRFTCARKWTDETDIDFDGQTLEASVMDVADDLTYAVHDFEELMLIGVIDADQLRGAITSYIAGDTSIFAELTSKWENYASFDENMLKKVCENLRDTQSALWLSPTSGASEITSWRNGRIKDLLDKVSLRDSPQGDRKAWVSLDSEGWHEVELYKFFATHYAIDNPRVQHMQFGQKQTLAGLVDTTSKWAEDHNEGSLLHAYVPRQLANLLNASSRDDNLRHGTEEERDAIAPQANSGSGRLDERRNSRAIIDYICTLGDAEADAINQAAHGYGVPSPWSGPYV